MHTTADPGQHSPALEWRQGLCTGVQPVDDEHRHLFDLIRQLDLANVQATLHELLAVVVTHFAHEQALMQQSGYPEFRAHQVLHEQLSTPLTEFLAEKTTWTAQRMQRLRQFLNEWLVGHILTHDLQFGAWYAEHHRVRAAPAPRRGWLQRLLGAA